MAKIPYTFELPPPDYFRKHGWFQSDNTLKFVTWGFARCSLETKEIIFNGRRIILKPFQFIFGRLKCSSETNMSEREVRTQQKWLEDSGFLKKTTNKTPNHFTIYEWVLESFSEKKDQPKDQQTTNARPTPDHKQDIVDLVDLKEEQQQGPSDVVVFSCFDNVPLEQIPMKQRETLCKKYSEQIIIDSLQVVLNKDFIPESSLSKSLNAACKGGWKPVNKQDNKKVNQAYAKMIKIGYKGPYILEVLNKNLEIILGGASPSKVISYDLTHEKFKKNVSEILKGKT